MDIAKFFYKLFLVNESGKIESFLGTAFPVEKNGGLLTCSHVVKQEFGNNKYIAVLDSETNKLVKINTINYVSNKTLDIAFLPNALKKEKEEYFPILTPQELKIGEDVYSFGYFCIGGAITDIEQGYFAGKIVNFTTANNSTSITLPYAVVEGMSGCPILTYHNGPKLVGIAYGNRSTRVLASEVVDVTEGETKYHETINRIIEFGLAYHPAEIVSSLEPLGINNATVSSGSVNIPSL